MGPMTWFRRLTRRHRPPADPVGHEPVYPPDDPDATEITRIHFENTHRVGWPDGPPDYDTMRKAGWEHGP